MALLGLLLLFSGVFMNIQVLWRSRKLGIEAQQIMRTPPWFVSTGMTVVGLILLLVGSR